MGDVEEETLIKGDRADVELFKDEATGAIDLLGGGKEFEGECRRLAKTAASDDSGAELESEAASEGGAVFKGGGAWEEDAALDGISESEVKLERGVDSGEDGVMLGVESEVFD